MRIHIIRAMTLLAVLALPILGTQTAQADRWRHHRHEWHHDRDWDHYYRGRVYDDDWRPRYHYRPRVSHRYYYRDYDHYYDNDWWDRGDWRFDDGWWIGGAVPGLHGSIHIH